MGCIYSKVLADECSDNEHVTSKRAHSSIKHLSEFKTSRSGSPKSEMIWEKDRLNCSDVTVMLFDTTANGSLRSHGKLPNEKKKTDIPDVTIINHQCIGKIPNAAEAEQVAAGWPSWLAVVAGEAIKGWLPKRANNFIKLEKIGQGTYSSVYKARDIIQDKVVALKRIRFDNKDAESIKFMAREILVLRRLDHPNIVKLEGLITSQTSCTMYLVFEYMEHDLTGLASRPGSSFTEPQMKCYMKQLLSGLDHCHSNGVLHRDIKGSNLLIDNNGILKIADFGLAVLFDSHSTVPMTSRVITLWYRPPELLLGSSKYGVEIDLWSAGCILGELYTGKPILPGKTEVEQLHKIFKLCGSPSKDYWKKLHLKHSTSMKPPQSYERCLRERYNDIPRAAVELMDTLLSIDPTGRGTAGSALNSEFFTTRPLPSDPSSLPKYPPSKEIDSKPREEEARRQQGIGGGRSQIVYQEAKGLKQSRVVPAAKPNAELVISLLRKQSRSSAKYRNETCSYGLVSKRNSNSEPVTQGSRYTNSKKEPKHVSMISSECLTSSGPIEFVSYKYVRERNGVSKPESMSQNKSFPLLSSSAEQSSIKKMNKDQVDMKKVTNSCQLGDSKGSALIVG
ncbi:probable serine/threonine-protein kinase At1g54610 isoform X2 [Benincasa hispida]|uniref:probable serine/threonine-protein kinase At1g54610 isoform X2 n=1 Tax=Benincasa hispida TaxID=102211 RepID=UPI001902ABE3|nr:probable serine/threonine-protein kinase At1g54610 isoform X2 [Benincasa hispida]